MTVAVLAFLLTHNSWAALALTAAYGLFLLSRPRVRRLIGRLQDQPTWDGYHWEAPRPPPTRTDRRR